MRRLMVAAFVIALCAGCAEPPKISAPHNAAPVIKELVCAHDAMARQDLELICISEDPDGDPLKYEWAADSGQFHGGGSNIVWITPDTMGDYTVEVRVSDGKGGVATKSVGIRVLTNADGTTTPNVDLKLSMSSGENVLIKRTVKVGTRTRIHCIVDNAAGGEIKYRWSKSGGFLKADPGSPALDSGSCDTAFFTAPPNVGHYLITVMAEDGMRNEAKGQVDFDVFCCPRY